MRILPTPRVLWLWLAIVLLAFAAPFSPAARALALAGVAALALASALDWTLSHRLLDEVRILPAQDRLRCAQGRPAPLVWEVRQTPPRARHLQLALGGASAELESAIALPAGELPLVLSAAERAAWRTELLPRRRGRFYGLRLALGTVSRLGLWQFRQRRFVPLEIRVHPDLRAARRAVLATPLYRLVAGAQRRPAVGQGREFERLREYLPGDGYQDISWKATARRDFPVSRVYQWEQLQEIYLCVDHSRLAALPALGASGESPLDPERGGTRGASRAASRPPRVAPPPDAPAAVPPVLPQSVIDLYISTALAAAATCHELGDQFGLVTFADEVTACLRAGQGSAHLSRCRELLTQLTLRAVTPDYAALAAYLKAALRRRAWVLILTQVGELGRDEELLRALEPVRGVHLLAVHSLLPPDTAPLPFAPPAAGVLHRATAAPEAATLDDVYRLLAGHREYRRLAELRRQFAQRGIALRLEPPAGFLGTAVDAYLDAKRRQAL